MVTNKELECNQDKPADPYNAMVLLSVERIRDARIKFDRQFPHKTNTDSQTGTVLQKGIWCNLPCALLLTKMFRVSLEELQSNHTEEI